MSFHNLSYICERFNAPGYRLIPDMPNLIRHAFRGIHSNGR